MPKEVYQREKRSITNLRPHEKNSEIYADRTDLSEPFEQSIEKNGIRNPIKITPDGTIISGHRRWEAAKRAGYDEVEVEIREYPNERAQIEALIDFGRHREKSFSQKMREADELEKIERERAKERQGHRTDLRENSPDSEDSEYGRRREKIADKTNIGSGKTYATARKIWNAAQRNNSLAKLEVDKIDRGDQSIHGAWKRIKDREKEEKNTTGPTEGISGSAEKESPASEKQDLNSEGDDETLDPDDLILAAHVAGNAEVFPKVLDLHVEDGATVADVTYGKGTFWKKVSEDRYKEEAIDLDPEQSPDYEQGADCRDLPYQDGELDCVVLDPPYTSGFYDSERTEGEGSHPLTDRYGGAPDGDLRYHDAVIQLYIDAAKEAQRVLRSDGTLIVKAQDGVDSGNQHFTHVEIINKYEDLGYSTKDLFVVVSENRRFRSYERQCHARKNHSYFLVFTN